MIERNQVLYYVDSEMKTDDGYCNESGIIVVPGYKVPTEESQEQTEIPGTILPIDYNVQSVSTSVDFALPALQIDRQQQQNYDNIQNI